MASVQEMIIGHSDVLIDLYKEKFSQRLAAKEFEKRTGISFSHNSVRAAWIEMGLYQPVTKPTVEQDSEDTELPIEKLIELRIEATRRKIAKGKRHHKTINMSSEPFGIFLLGDPHVDNEGCDWALLHEHVQTVQQYEGVYASCVGDIQDHWIGRLGRLYANSSVTAADGWRLSKWLFNSLDWLAIVGGNHDSWSHAAGMDPYSLLTELCGVLCYAPDELKIRFIFPDEDGLEDIYWILRHDFPGRSFYHPTHGPHKKGMLDGRVHLLTGGHIHSWGELKTEHNYGRVCTAIRVRGYKRNDTYAREKGFEEQQHGAACLIVIDPKAKDPARIQIYWDIKRGCEMLKALRAT